MNDLISRQAAIEALDEQIENCDKSLSSFDISMKDAYAVKVERASLVAFREILEYLPPAQPERGAIEQIKWERDVAIEQLKKLGYGLGEKIRAEKDCISRQAAIDYFVTNVGFHDEDGCPIEDECELREIWTGYFDGIPPAQPERIKGRWIHDGHHIRCDQCREYMCDKDAEGDRIPTNFCPNCGADMRGEQDE